MNDALQRWRDDFARDPGPAFDRLARGIVPLGAAGQLSLGEILDVLFEPGDAALDAAAAAWLEERILAPLPDGALPHRWAALFAEYFRAIAAMELPRTGEVLRSQHERLRLWLRGFYEGPDRDPEGASLIALARAQVDQRFSPLWRRLILGEELAGRVYQGIGILGFRKMPGPDGRETADVPEGLLQALVELAGKPGSIERRWKQTIRSLFAVYRRSENYWGGRFVPLLSQYQEPSAAREWLKDLLPGVRELRSRETETNHAHSYPVRHVPVQVSRDWAQGVGQDPRLCDSTEFEAFLEEHRSYARTTGDPEYINKTLNNLAIAIIRADDQRAGFAVSLMEEALDWAPRDPRNWTSYAKVLCAANRDSDAIQALWHARHRFAWNPFIRNELGRILRENGDWVAAEGVLREAVGHFPRDVVSRTGLAETLRGMNRLGEARDVYEQACRDFPSNVFSRTGLAETLRAMNRLGEARNVYEQACRDFPRNVVSRNGLADLLIVLGESDKAERLYREALAVDSQNHFTRGGIARVLAIQSARTRDAVLREEAKGILEELAEDGNSDARRRLLDFDHQWERATTDPTVTFRSESGHRELQRRSPDRIRPIEEMSLAERLGRAMIALWQTRHAEDASVRAAHCAEATALLDVAEQATDDDLIAAFVETRGLVLLASGDARGALAYFEEQVNRYGRGGWIGIRLGEQRARTLLGEPGDLDHDGEPSDSLDVRFAFSVAKVIQALSASPRESEIRDLLKTLYPRAVRLAAQTQPDPEQGLSFENGAQMLGSFLEARWFAPAGIRCAEDLDQPGALRSVMERINRTPTDTFDVISNATMALAA